MRQTNQPEDSIRLGPHPRGAPATTQPAVARLGQLLSQWSRQADLRQLDHYVFHKLWRWATRRHPKKSQAWKKRKYFSAAGRLGFSASRSNGGARAACSSSTGWPAPDRTPYQGRRAGQALRPAIHPILRAAPVLCLARLADGTPNGARPRDTLGVIRIVARIAAACPHQAHRLERLEPYEGKLSSTVLRGGRAGNCPPPLDPPRRSAPIDGVQFATCSHFPVPGPPSPTAVYSKLPSLPVLRFFFCRPISAVWFLPRRNSRRRIPISAFPLVLRPLVSAIPPASPRRNVQQPMATTAICRQSASTQMLAVLPR